VFKNGRDSNFKRVRGIEKNIGHMTVVNCVMIIGLNSVNATTSKLNHLTFEIWGMTMGLNRATAN